MLRAIKREDRVSLNSHTVRVRNNLENACKTVTTTEPSVLFGKEMRQ